MSSVISSSETDLITARRYSVGAETCREGGVSFRVWAPERRSVEVVFDGADENLPRLELEREIGGYFRGVSPAANAGALYRYRLDGDDAQLFPDPASRFQPHGPFGPSQVIDAERFTWTDSSWNGVAPKGQIIYEMHVGTFTPEGTWRAAEQQLPELAAAGISLLEIMPVADFAGQFGWGYDGVNLFAPTRLYGSPDEFRSFIDRAHSLDVGVLLDVVYNHFGLVGNFQLSFSRYYHSDRHHTEWGAAVNFDGENSAPVREFMLANVRYWIEEFHVDGYRVDATQAFYDDSPRHILCDLGIEARRAAAGKQIFLLGENEPQQVRNVRPCDQGGFGLDALWNDDFHHSLLVRLTGRREAYYSDYLGSPEEFVALAKRGFLYQGQFYHWQGKPRGSPTFGLGGETFVNYLENHDQLANSARGQRLWQMTSPGRFRAATAYLLLAPGTPLVFQGQEFSASSPFVYFLDSQPDMAEAVAEGRASFLQQFSSLATTEAQQCLADPADRQTFERAKLDFADRERQAMSYRLHRDLIWLRRRDAVFSSQNATAVDGARLSDDAFVLRYFGGELGDRLLLVNFGAMLELRRAPEPLLAPLESQTWHVLWSSESPEYGGWGTPSLFSQHEWRLPGESAVVMTSQPNAP
ncbi:MAG TPA: malto-oligosyltrehalose trehalohydrolase [Pirellulales bacterium]|nr:malto-oligosyltrehalose trehalohydrolase [Pirellulales bacterium]